MKKDVTISKNKVGGNIVVATHPGVISHVFKATLDLRREFPNVKVNLVEGDTIFVINHVKNGHADLGFVRSEEHTSELQSRGHLVCRLLLEKKNKSKV